MLTLKPGDQAPPIEGTDQNGQKISLKDFRGKRVVLYFYPKDMTPGCTAQACDLRDHYSELKKAGFEVIGVSTDSETSHKKFEQKYVLPFRLLADPDKKIVSAYGVYGEKKFMGRTFLGTHRTTFLIDENGILRSILTKPDTKNHTSQVLDAWESSQ